MVGLSQTQGSIGATITGTNHEQTSDTFRTFQIESDFVYNRVAVRQVDRGAQTSEPVGRRGSTATLSPRSNRTEITESHPVPAVKPFVSHPRLSAEVMLVKADAAVE